MRTKFGIVIALAVGAAGVPRAAAWGPDGHDLVGKVADQHLDVRARQAVSEVLQGH